MNAMYQEAVAAARAEASNFELLLFRLGGDAEGHRSELFGIDVFNVREIVAMPPISSMAGASKHVLGLVNLRGQTIQVIDLPAIAGCIPSSGLNIMLVTELGASTQAFAVESVEEIVLLDVCQLAPAAYGRGNPMVGSIARLDDGRAQSRLAQVLNIATILKRLDRPEISHAARMLPGHS